MATLISDIGRKDHSPFPSSSRAHTTPQPSSFWSSSQQLLPASSACSAESDSTKSATSTSATTSLIPTPPDASPSTRSHLPSGHGPSAPRMASFTEPASTAVGATSSSSFSSSVFVPNTTTVPAPSASRTCPPTNAIPSPASDDTRAQAIEGLASQATAKSAESLADSSSQMPRATATAAAAITTAIPSPGIPASPPPHAVSALPPSPPSTSPPRAQRTIRIHNLGHIQRLAHLDVSTGNGPGILHEPALQDMKFEISSMPIGDIIEMVAALLTKITTTNDQQHDALHRNVSQQRQAQVHNEAASTSATGTELHGSPFSASVLAFHGKNVPGITILSYLSRIHKYCPTTYEVFLSLLVYFDRMTERVNNLVMRDVEQREHERKRQAAAAATTAVKIVPSGKMPATTTPTEDVAMQDASMGETDDSLADSADDDDAASSSSAKSPSLSLTTLPATYFVVDSFNIHRLVIAGVTCASKFFSDVFYTNSRYAKVGGLPLAELNHLELQFLILNDFRLAIPIEDLEAYATMLVEFYAREVVGQRPRPSGGV